MPQRGGEGMDRILIARTARCASSVEDGKWWWIEYAIRPVGPEDLNSRYAQGAELVLEFRYQGGRTGIDEDWRPFDYGRDPIELAACNRNRDYREAESLHPWHAQGIRRIARELQRGRWRDRVRVLASEQWVRQVRAEGEAAYQEALKKTRLFKAAQEGRAPQERVVAIRRAVLREWGPKLDRAQRIAAAAQRTMETF